VDPHVSKLRIVFALDEVVADFVDELQILSEDFAEGLRDGLEQDEAIDDREVRPCRDGVLVAPIVRRTGHEIAQIDVFDFRSLIPREGEVVGRQAVAEPAAPGVDLNEEGMGIHAVL
jgi:hypothetical protein